MLDGPGDVSARLDTTRTTASKATTRPATAGQRRDAGRIVVDGEPHNDSASGTFVSPMARRFGYVFQDARLFPHLVVEQNLTFGTRYAPAHAPGATLEDVTALLGIGDLLSRMPATLSGGEKQRVAIGRALLSRPRMLLMDEPTNHLDMEGKEELIETLQDFEGAALLVSHDRSLIEHSCNRFWFIENGLLTEYLSAEEVYQRVTDTAPKSAISHHRNEVMSMETNTASDGQSEEQMLERLLELESLLEADLGRKPKHQKPAMQKQWQQEIEEITAQL